MVENTNFHCAYCLGGFHIYDVRSGWGRPRGVPKKQTKGKKSDDFVTATRGGGGQKIRKFCGHYIWKPLLLKLLLRAYQRLRKHATILAAQHINSFLLLQPSIRDPSLNVHAGETFRLEVRWSAGRRRDELCIKIGLPRKLILSKIKGLLEV